MNRCRSLTGRAVATALVAAAMGGVIACTGDKSNPIGPVYTIPKAITVAFAGGTVSAEIAATFAARETGLMNRNSIAADSGMIFIWPTDRQQQVTGFWMKNTHIDLSIAFIDANKKVINIEEMVKETETSHYATAPYRFAVEAPKGWFAAHGVVAGSTATFTIPAGVIIDP